MSLPPFRLGRRMRHAVCLLLAIVLALSPVLSTAAQTHEAAHTAQGDRHFHAHEAHHGTSHDAMGPEAERKTDDMPDAGGVLHLLAHAAHACGHAVAILGVGLAAPRADGACVALPARVTTPGDAPSAHPFRPPIG